MTIEKTCETCKEKKPLGDFFAAPFDGRAASIRTSKHCKSCHADGLIPYGYGWPGYGDKFKTPETT